MKTLILILCILGGTVTAHAQTANGTFSQTYPITTTTTTDGTVTCTLSSARTVLTCTMSTAIQTGATFTINIPAGL